MVFVKLLSELRLSFRTTYVTNANMAVGLAQFPLFPPKENGLKEVKIIISMGMMFRAAAQ